MGASALETSAIHAISGFSTPTLMHRLPLVSPARLDAPNARTEEPLDPSALPAHLTLSTTLRQALVSNAPWGALTAWMLLTIVAPAFRLSCTSLIRTLVLLAAVSLTNIALRGA